MRRKSLELTAAPKRRRFGVRLVYGFVAATLFGATAATVVTASPAFADCFTGAGASINYTVFENNGITQAPTQVARVGDRLEYTAVVQNAAGNCAFTNGNVTLTTPDGVVHTLDTSLALQPGDSHTYLPPTPYVVNQNDVGQHNATAGSVRATVSVSAQVDVPGDATASNFKDAPVIHPITTLTKVPDKSTINPGDTVTYTFTESNISNDPAAALTLATARGAPNADSITSVTLSDNPPCPILTSSTVPVSGDNAPLGSLDPGESWVFTCQVTYNTPGTFPDTATATGNAGDQREAGTVASNGAPADETAPASITVATPCVNIVKTTNGADANDPNGSDVPEVAPGGAITWLYTVTNCGTSHVAAADVHVTDNGNPAVTPVFDHEQSGNGDAIFDPNEVWIYKATGTALDLTAPPGGSTTVTGVCTHNNTEPPRTGYVNTGTATIPGSTDTDPSSYCNPPPPPGNANFTPGFWKNHPNATNPLLPQPLGNYSVDTFAKAQAILNGMGCGKNGPLQCMAGMLLAAELNLAQGGPTCIQSVVNQANALLAANNYAGFKSTPYTVSASDSALAMQLHDQLSAYNIDGVPTC